MAEGKYVVDLYYEVFIVRSTSLLVASHNHMSGSARQDLYPMVVNELAR
jgi:hypothetical protein